MIFKAPDGTLLYGCSAAAEQPRADVLIVHGLGEHSGRYDLLTQDLIGQHYNVHRFDLRGHGRSGGLRGHVENFADYFGDLDAWLGSLEGQGLVERDRPLLLLGHSLGGLIALGYTLQRKEVQGPRLRGLALSAPALGMASPFAGAQYLLAKSLPLLLKTVHLPSGIRADQLSHQRAVIEAYQADPLVHPWVTPAFYEAFCETLLSLPVELPKLKIPVLFLLAGDDTVVDTEAALKMARELEELGQAQVECKVYSGFFHEIFNETKREQPLLALRKWIRRCIDTKTTPNPNNGSSRSSGRKATGKGNSPSPRGSKATSIST